MDSNQTPDEPVTISQAQNAKILHLLNNDRKLIASGVIKLLKIQSTYSISVDNRFNQVLIPATPIVLKKDNNSSTLIFPNVEQGLNGIHIVQSDESMQFIQDLENIVQLIPIDQALQLANFKEAIDLHCKDILQIPLDQDKSTVTIIQKGGEYELNSIDQFKRFFKKSFIWIGAQASTGITKAGNYLNEKVSPGEPINISDDNKTKLNQLKTGVDKTFDFAGNILMKVITPVQEKTKELKEIINVKIDQSNNEGILFFNIQNHKVLIKGKQITVATWDAAGNALQGLGEGISQVSNSIGDSTKKIIGKKFGGAQNQQQQQIQEQLNEPLLEQQQ